MKTCKENSLVKKCQHTLQTFLRKKKEKKILKFALIIGVDFKFFEFSMTDIYTIAILSLYLDLILVSSLES